MADPNSVSLIRLIAQRRLPTSVLLTTNMQRSLIAAVEAMVIACGAPFLGTVPRPIKANTLHDMLSQVAEPSAGGKPEVDRRFGAGEIAEGLRRGQFEVFFQPKVEVRSGELKGAEALVRWRHPEFGIVFPSAFIETVETAGLVDELTSIVAKLAMADCREWRAAGLDIGVSVNLSVLSLQDPSFADSLAAIASAAAVDPAQIVLEITESAAPLDLGRKVETLLRLRMKGFGLSIDDYGTGYSSMKRLTRAPFTELKIDQGFVRGAVRSDSDRALVESSLHVASRLGIPAVAEGIESYQEWQLMLSLGCAMAQGYYIARPMPAPAFRDWARNRGQVSA
jgi:EAL domain-containing protein (putative c-di-GMP-specific phosphodiesterase class I)